MTEHVNACPNPDCESSDIYERKGDRYGADERWRCRECSNTFAEPIERPVKHPSIADSRIGQALVDADNLDDLRAGGDA